MGFFQKVKGFFGYGILDIDVHPNSTTIDRHHPLVVGKVTITAKTEDFIEKITMKVEEVWQKKDINANPVHESFRLGDLEFDVQKNFTEGETFSLDFQMPLRLVKSFDDRLRDKGGIIGAAGKMSSLLKSEKSNFWLDTTVHVKSASFEPNKVVELFLSN
jgi:hypothetical protein